MLSEGKALSDKIKPVDHFVHQLPITPCVVPDLKRFAPHPQLLQHLLGPNIAASVDAQIRVRPNALIPHAITVRAASVAMPWPHQARPMA